MTALRVLETILSGPLLLVGISWVLQGLNLLPGSFMTGQIIWAVYGAPHGDRRRGPGLMAEPAPLTVEGLFPALAAVLKPKQPTGLSLR